MSFNPDINKQVQELSFSQTSEVNHPSLMFTGITITQSEIQNCLGMFLDSKLDFKDIGNMCSVRLIKR